MADIKSAWEIAREKLEKIGEATPEEKLQWKYIPEGGKLAARFLREDFNLVSELAQFKDEGARKYVSKGIQDVLVKNITLPRNDNAKKVNKRVMDMVKNLKNDKVAVENIFSKMRRIFSHYVGPGEEQRKQVYEELKFEIGRKLQQALQQQMGAQAANMRIDIERQPEFQAEWRKTSRELDSQYEKHLEEYKAELSTIN
ncbi:MAG: hypothetical protein FJ045_06230 [Crenarchaeota archaeon]|nr:hypothetical protein [Thermoproteota archaeon]